VGNGLGGFLGR